jgi:hypothetical protein
MRHSDIKLTMGVYTDPKLLDVRGALDALPGLPLAGGQAEGEAVRATGTDGDFRRGICLVAPLVAPTPDNSGTTLSNAGNAAISVVPNNLAVSDSPVNGKGRLSSTDNRP